MKLNSPRITPFLWFDTRAEEAAQFYTSVFPNSEIKSVTRYDEAGAAAPGRAPGSVMTIAFQLDGQEFVAINGGPHFPFDCAVSFVVNCADQDEVDFYWEQLSEEGAPEAQQCGWLADKFGLSWQVIPTLVPELMTHANPEVAARTMQAVLGMKKIDLEAIRNAVSDLV